MIYVNSESILNNDRFFSLYRGMVIHIIGENHFSIPYFIFSSTDNVPLLRNLIIPQYKIQCMNPANRNLIFSDYLISESNEYQLTIPPAIPEAAHRINVVITFASSMSNPLFTTADATNSITK